MRWDQPSEQEVVESRPSSMSAPEGADAPEPLMPETATSTSGRSARPKMVRLVSAPAKVRVVVADDHPVYREGLVGALRASGQIEIVAEADEGRDALAKIQEHEPDVAVLDFKLPGLDALDLMHAIIRDGLGTRVLIVSAYTDAELVYKAVQEGAAGYLPKEARRESIVDGVLAVSRGQEVLPSELVGGLMDQVRLRSPAEGPVLTGREREILKLIAEGKSLPQIAEELVVGVTTVKTHVAHLYNKLGVNDRAAAVAVGMRRRIIE